MPNDLDNTENMARQEAAPTTPVFDVKGEHVGEVSMWSRQDDYFVMERGIFFKHTLYVPYTAIKAQDENGITLSLLKDDLTNEQWRVPPTGSAEAETASSLPPPVTPGAGMPSAEPGALSNPTMPPEQPLGNR